MKNGIWIGNPDEIKISNIKFVKCSDANILALLEFIGAEVRGSASLQSANQKVKT